MAAQRSRIPYEQLRHHIPENAWLLLWPLLQRYPLSITLWNHRQSKFGDYKAPQRDGIHHISLNKSQNQFAFLITTIHELAHMEVQERYGRYKQPHGREWKRVFQQMMNPFLAAGCFPEELARQLVRHMTNPKATTSSDPCLMKVLSDYDEIKGVMLEEVPENAIFRMENGMVFRKGSRLRSRFNCFRVDNERLYYVPALIRVEPL
ncbi:MAG: sprT domain-containing protein [Flavobacteriales bacterium]|nr:sprT domain-containing protein [Flavobacteriales bacterium]MCB9449147.1 sprT domain-containing protein [Flavobacteriales bacterium]